MNLRGNSLYRRALRINRRALSYFPKFRSSGLRYRQAATAPERLWKNLLGQGNDEKGAGKIAGTQLKQRYPSWQTKHPGLYLNKNQI
ncbi:MAG: hypothetical protein ACREYE_10510, partial [Gammaproteobacteria bacterium]